MARVLLIMEKKVQMTDEAIFLPLTSEIIKSYRKRML
jgi:hypothetical protein